MKRRNILRFVILSLAILALVSMAPTASASVIGHLVVGTCGAGDVIVSAGLINWEPTVSGIAACLSVSGGTNVTSVGLGNLVAPPVFTGVSTINDLTIPTSGGEIGFMSFVGGSPAVNMHFDLTALGPGVSNACTVGMVNGQSCSVAGISPFLLTVNNGGTSVSLSANGTILDTVGPISFWSGAFTTQINNLSPFQLQSIILTGGAIKSSFSGEFDITTVPEPISMVLIGGGLIVLGAIKRRKLV